MTAPVNCEMCGTPSDQPHNFRHRFQYPDKDPVLEVPKPEEPQQKVVPVTGPEGMMIMLLRVLSQKGVLDGDDLARILTGDATSTPPSSGGEDSQPGTAEAP
jgi:hypothetical protein